MTADFWTTDGRTRRVARPRTIMPRQNPTATSRRRPPTRPITLPSRRAPARKTSGINGITMLLAAVAVGAMGHFAGWGLQSLTGFTDSGKPPVVQERVVPTASFVF